MAIKVRKADGEVEYFKVEKLRRSLRRSGADKKQVEAVVEKIIDHISDGMHTQEIYRRAFELLHDIQAPVAARYSLRRALFALGPTGFPFEQFLARLFEAEGYSTRVGIEIRGKCALHELDIAAYKHDHSFVAEAKFHTRPGIRSDLQVAMYSYARLVDLQKQKICSDDICGITQFWLITNTKFTKPAIEYGECSGLTMLSWNYPKRDNLHDRIQRAGIYPITILQTLSRSQIVTLLESEVILCREILEQPSVLKVLHKDESFSEEVLQEIRGILN